MMFRKREKKEIPGLNTAALPDLIFTVLFFFMIVTHMRSVPMKVKYQVPAGTEITKLVKKSTVTYIYIGKVGDDYRIQLNDELATPAEVETYVKEELARMLPEDARNQTVSIRADRSAPMHLITEVKQALRRAKAYRINYSATGTVKTDNN
ncbi:MAG: biopolymer transporter ExbD [Prevotella sp.]|nr:biopolymer transporter ExbD [Prevotella sp.]